ncbi:MAG: YihY/virulence factor BrkB family protein [Bryobacterales bacterium]|nr:YihY/virulence factor BrkB family protein [Bryobacterales bacterium]
MNGSEKEGTAGQVSFSLTTAEEEHELETAPSALARGRTHVVTVVRYWLGLDSHVYAMAISVNVLLGFFPFMLLILSISHYWLSWSGAERAIYVGLRAFLPADPGLVEFVERNLRAAVEMRGAKVKVVSVVLLLAASNGVFMPLEVALNRLWGFTAHRPYWKNQAMALGMTFVMGVLALIAAIFAGGLWHPAERLAGGWFDTPNMAILALLKVGEIHAIFVMFLLIYWLLPNGPVPFGRAAVTAAVLAVLYELGQSLYSWIWPSLDLRSEYGPFFISVTLVLWGFFVAMVALAAGKLYARPDLIRRPE